MCRRLQVTRGRRPARRPPRVQQAPLRKSPSSMSQARTAGRAPARPAEFFILTF
jgi:hypothetical protein